MSKGKIKTPDFCTNDHIIKAIFTLTVTLSDVTPHTEHGMKS